MADDIWTIKRILEWIEGYLASHGDDNPRVSAQWLVSEALGISRMHLFLDGERPLTAEERGVLRDWTRRRGEGEPLQYITGEVAFRHITVKVREGVLIPRPETEVLVSEALALLPAAPRPQDELDDKIIRELAEAGALRPAGTLEDLASNGFSTADALVDGAGGTVVAGLAESASDEGEGRLLVADICTGSGCIACAIAHEHPLARVIATDISPAAVSLARENARALDLDERVEIAECDLGEGIDGALSGKFDLVVSNPPYVPSGVLAQLPEEVSAHEPRLALDGGPDGLEMFRRLLEWCAQALKPGGGCAFELHETCLDAAAEHARALGFADVSIARDLADRPRILTARKAQA